MGQIKAANWKQEVFGKGGDLTLEAEVAPEAEAAPV